MLGVWETVSLGGFGAWDAEPVPYQTDQCPTILPLASNHKRKGSLDLVGSLHWSQCKGTDTQGVKSLPNSSTEGT